MCLHSSRADGISRNFCQQSAGGKSYPELAKISNKIFFRHIVERLDDISKDSYPHDVKCLRKEIGYMKILVDIFMYAYDPGKSSDKILKLRREFDYGYEVFGDFKDEFDRDPEISDLLSPYKISRCKFSPPGRLLKSLYNSKVVKQKRLKIISWSKSIVDRQKQIEKTLDRVSLKKLAKRKKSKLSRLYWGGVDFQPQLGVGGLVNIKALQKGIVSVAVTEYESLFSLESIVEHGNEQRFHDFRKRARSVLRIDLLYPCTKNELQGTVILLSELDVFIKELGKINDLFLTYHSIDKNDYQTKQNIENRINNEWHSLRLFSLESDLYEKLQRLLQLYI